MKLSIDLDNDVKSAADNLFESYGINTVDAVRMFIYTTVKTKRFPFPLKLDFEQRQSLEEAMNDALNDTNLYGPFSCAKEAIDAALRD
jgi:addiction module RelB/DinJ family antitoxin